MLIDFFKASLKTPRDWPHNPVLRFRWFMCRSDCLEPTCTQTQVRILCGASRPSLRVLTNLGQRELSLDFPGEALGRTSEVAHAIAQPAQEGVDLIVMAAPGSRRFQHALSRPMAERVAWVAPCPVLRVNKKVL